MNNSEQTPNLEQNNTKAMFDKIFRRTQMLTNHKDELLRILNTFESATRVISKIQHESVITQTEHRVLKKFIEDRGLSTDISSVYEEILTSRDKEGTLNHLNNFTQVVDTYPYVVDADEVSEDISQLLGSGIAEIRKNGRRGLVKKTKSPDGEDEIQTLFDHNYSQDGVLTFSPEEYEKYGLVKVINHKVISEDSYHIMFLKREKEPLDRFVRLSGNYHMLKDFDRDGIGFNFGGGSCFYLIYKDISSDSIKINQISEVLRSNPNDVLKGFDEYNSFTAEGRMIYKKKYDKEGKINGISVFKKSLMGKETLVGNYEISK